MHTLPLRLMPGDDLRGALDAALAAQGVQAAFVLAGIGSLRPACLRLAGAETIVRLEHDVEILTLSGSLSTNGSHLHVAVSDAQGRVTGGHVTPGCFVRTTVEVLLALLPEWHFERAPDASTGYAELQLRRQSPR